VHVRRADRIGGASVRATVLGAEPGPRRPAVRIVHSHLERGRAGVVRSGLPSSADEIESGAHPRRGREDMCARFLAGERDRPDRDVVDVRLDRMSAVHRPGHHRQRKQRRRPCDDDEGARNSTGQAGRDGGLRGGNEGAGASGRFSVTPFGSTMALLQPHRQRKRPKSQESGDCAGRAYWADWAGDARRAARPRTSPGRRPAVPDLVRRQNRRAGRGSRSPRPPTGRRRSRTSSSTSSCSSPVTRSGSTSRCTGRRQSYCSAAGGPGRTSGSTASAEWSRSSRPGTALWPASTSPASSSRWKPMGADPRPARRLPARRVQRRTGRPGAAGADHRRPDLEPRRARDGRGARRTSARSRRVDARAVDVVLRHR